MIHSERFKKIDNDVWEFQFRILDEHVPEMMQWIMKNHRVHFKLEPLYVSTNTGGQNQIVLSDSLPTLTFDPTLFAILHRREYDWVLTCCDKIYNLLQHNSSPEYVSNRLIDC